ncbi:tetratricopeptide repeat protein [Gelidibacter salicanalis]|uniref:Tetratricopeptide repeat protein n=1 Tax=Gelidibacter salicanalis TaxID=291193 RepID=A0A934KT59_9FLAO|nr:tetratricopeptide repeat protein [Gelidibacter salicanalis]MBJ7880901.1 tetratricopeptide repeat protein [Gelidibacter salicanalis]
MKAFLWVIIFGMGFLSYSQNDEEQLAADYYKRGEFQKALLSYQKLYKEQPGNYNYIFHLIKTYQELEQFDDAEALITSKMTQYRNPSLIIELGYNFQLRNDVDKATAYYNEALAKLEERLEYAALIARQFEQHSLLEYAIKSYEKGMELDPNLNYYRELASAYGEQGNIELLFSNYMAYVDIRPEFLNSIKREFSDFVSENKDNQNNILLKKLLLRKIQTQPDTYWYELLSWLFIQEKDYNKAFTQEKALYMRQRESLNRIIEVALTALSDKKNTIATDIFNYVLEHTQDISAILEVNRYLLTIATDAATPKDLIAIEEKYQELFFTYGRAQQTLTLQIAYANFLAFQLNRPEDASIFLKETLKLNLPTAQQATVKMTLGNILVFQEKFNEGLIYYTQIQANLKNSPIAQEARFKVAKTSYYKGDFEWAESQLKVLKSSTSQLIANDALDLKLLISDNKYEDSLQVALKLYAKADLMAFQNKTDAAIALLDRVLTEHKGESIEDQALFKQAELFQQKKQYNKAIANYEAIIAHYSDGILADDAYYYLAELYNNILDQPDLAKSLYEKLIFNHQDSIYFVEARKQFRRLRGDAIN